jgi:acyl-[acyl-carrier-protein]-phospholipid O-acyltransferase/long-chain-fatty-acid--[acyl-carrier-protein] ligase
MHYLLKQIRFLPFLICQFLSAFGDNFIRTAFATLVSYQSTILSSQEGHMMNILSIILFIFPFILFSSLGGQLADKYDKSTIIKHIKLGDVFVAIIAVAGFMQENYYFLLAVIFLTGIQASFFGAVKYSIIPEILDKKELILGNGLVECTTFLGILLGMILGGSMIGNDYVGKILCSGITVFLIITAYIASLFMPKLGKYDSSIKISFNLIKDSTDCVKYAMRNEQIFTAILGISWFWLVGSILIAQMPSFTKDALHGNQNVFLLLLTMFTLGTGFGSLFCNWLLKGEISPRYVPTSILLMSFFIFDLWLTGVNTASRVNLIGVHYFLSDINGIRACIDIFMTAAMGGIYIVPLYSILQTLAKKHHVSRIIAANNIVNSVFMVSASSIVMIMVAIGLQTTNIIFILALTNLYTAVYSCRILPDTVVKNFCRMLLTLLYRVEVVGMENYYKAGKKTLIVANHASFIDPAIISSYLPTRLTFAIDAYIAQSWWLKPFLSFLRAYPIDPTHPMAMKTLIDKLKQNNHVVIFPEGRLTVTGSLMKIYEGPGMIADKADSTLLPIRLEGLQFSRFSYMRGKLRLKLFPKIKMVIFEPQKLNIPDEISGRERRYLIGDRLYDIMSNMMFAGSELDKTIFECLLTARSKFGGDYKIIEDVEKNKLSYNKLIAASFVLGKKIKKIVGDERNIGILLPNMVGSMVTFFACLAYLRVPAMLNFSTGIKNLLASCKAAQINYVLTSRAFIEKGRLQTTVDALIADGIKIIYLDDIKKDVRLTDKLIGAYKGVFANRFFAENAEEFASNSNNLLNEPAVILFTSGSEGIPKGVVLSHSNILSNIQQLTSRVDFSSADKVFNALPIFHSFGLTAGSILPIISGVKVYFYPSPIHYRIIPEVIYGNNATILFGTDTFLAGYAKYAHAYDFYSIRYVFAGAEKLREETRRLWMENFGIRIFEGYGTTEASPAVAVNTPMQSKFGTVGRFLPNIQYTIEKIDGINEGGKLVIKGPNIMMGYLRHDKPGILQRPSYVINGKKQYGWYDTGDIVTVDEQGYITIKGRQKRFAKIGGEMVSLTSVEEAINKLWPENDNAIINVNDDKKGEALVLFTNRPSPEREEIVNYLQKENLSEIYIPKMIIFMEEMPVLSTGKIDYQAIIKCYEDR